MNKTLVKEISNAEISYIQLSLNRTSTGRLYFWETLAHLLYIFYLNWFSYELFILNKILLFLKNTYMLQVPWLKIDVFLIKKLYNLFPYVDLPAPAHSKKSNTNCYLRGEAKQKKNTDMWWYLLLHETITFYFTLTYFFVTAIFLSSSICLGFNTLEQEHDFPPLDQVPLFFIKYRLSMKAVCMNRTFQIYMHTISVWMKRSHQ